jgi:hypothetical protein
MFESVVFIPCCLHSMLSWMMKEKKRLTGRDNLVDQLAGSGLSRKHCRFTLLCGRGGKRTAFTPPSAVGVSNHSRAWQMPRKLVWLLPQTLN